MHHIIDIFDISVNHLTFLYEYVCFPVNLLFTSLNFIGITDCTYNVFNNQIIINTLVLYSTFTPLPLTILFPLYPFFFPPTFLLSCPYVFMYIYVYFHVFMSSFLMTQWVLLWLTLNPWWGIIYNNIINNIIYNDIDSLLMKISPLININAYKF